MENNNSEGIAEVSLIYKRKAGTCLAIISSEQAYNILLKAYDEDTIQFREEFKILLLDPALQVLGVCCISQGGIDTTAVDVRLILQAALLANSTRIILCHNHPSGNIKSSLPDDQLTRKIQQAASVMDIKVEDHLIISGKGYYSYADEGKL
ncbi:MAG: repair protein [Bacteroidetes bacterium]|nr:repair protein [Bacteroidota bacterium]